MEKRIIKGPIFSVIVFFILFIYIVEYVVLFVFNADIHRFPSIIDIVVFLLIVVAYFMKFRSKNVLCFELFFLPVFFVGMFFYDIVDNSMVGMGIGGALNNMVTSEYYVAKGRVLQMVAFLSLVLGCSIANNRSQQLENARWDNYRIHGKFVDNKAISVVISLIVFYELVKDYQNGFFDTWFAYSKDIAVEDRNIGYSTLRNLCSILTVFEFSRLSQIGVDSFRSFLSKSHKLYLIEILFISVLLFITGNRNEMLLILLPTVICYSLFIHKFKPRNVLLGAILGIALMIGSGLTRHGEQLDLNELNLYSAIKDYSLVTPDCNYIVKYADEIGFLHFSEFPLSILSGIPIIGHRMIDMLGLSYAKQSTFITTEGMAEWDSGLGTSIVGDLYYNGHFLFVLIYMLFFGWMISKLHNRFNIEKKYNVYLLVIYLYMVSDGVYYIREQWDFPLKSLLYSCIVIFILSVLFNRSKP